MSEDIDPFAHLDARNNPTPASDPNPHKRVREELEGSPAEQRHTCLECNGTGRYRGPRVHQEQDHCFNCGGKGWLKKPYHEHKRAKAERKAKREATIAAKLQAKMDAFSEANPGLIEALRDMAGWNSFAGSMLANFGQWGSLTENQVAACQRMIAKVEAGRAERNKAQAANRGEVSMAAIEEMFAEAKRNGLKRPRFITDRLAISLAGPESRNPGAIYVKCDGQYAGKIVAGQFDPIRSAPQGVLDLVRAVAASPIEAARKYGRDTGTCSCCGRKLTDKESIAAGIGPVCASNWGL